MAMVNKMKFWRKMAKKQPDGTRTGRTIRNYMSGTNHPGMLSPIHIWLFRAAGIATPVYDEQQKMRQKAMKAYQDKLSAKDEDVIDVSFTEGTTNAA